METFTVLQKHWINDHDEWRPMFPGRTFETRQAAVRAAQMDASRWYPDQPSHQRAYLSHVHVVCQPLEKDK